MGGVYGYLAHMTGCYPTRPLGDLKVLGINCLKSLWWWRRYVFRGLTLEKKETALTGFTAVLIFVSIGGLVTSKPNLQGTWGCLIVRWNGARCETTHWAGVGITAKICEGKRYNTYDTGCADDIDIGYWFENRMYLHTYLLHTASPLLNAGLSDTLLCLYAW